MTKTFTTIFTSTSTVPHTMTSTTTTTSTTFKAAPRLPLQTPWEQYLGLACGGILIPLLVLLAHYLWKRRRLRSQQPSNTADRFAFLVSVQKYDHQRPLQYCHKDSDAVKRQFENLGYSVTQIKDPTKDELHAALKIFLQSLAGRDEALAVIYFAAHFLELGSEAILVTREAQPDQPDQHVWMPHFLQAVQDINVSCEAERLSSTSTKRVMCVVIYDGCRLSPPQDAKKRFTDYMAHHDSRLSSRRILKSDRTLFYIVHACDPGMPAGESAELEHGYFTNAFLRHMAKPQPISQLFEVVGEEVQKQTRGSQRPWTTHSTGLRQMNVSLAPPADVCRSTSSISAETTAESFRNSFSNTEALVMSA